MRYLYNLYLTLLLSLGWPLWLPMVLVSNKRRQVLASRLGLGRNAARPRLREAAPIWVHALSVGEVTAALPLVAHLRQRWPGLPIVFSVSTITGLNFARARLAADGCQIFYFPWDLGLIIRRVLRRIRPCCVILVESDVWPNFGHLVKAAGIPLLLVNARLSARSRARYARFKPVARLLYANFDAICTQSLQDSHNFSRLGLSASQLHACGNLKFDQLPPPLSACRQQALRKRLGVTAASRLLVAGSTHPGEEHLLLSAFQRLIDPFPALVLVLAPRDPKRAPGLRTLARTLGLQAACLSEQSPDAALQLIVIDRIGLLQELYALAEIAIIGGSFKDFGGHNPLEAVLQARPVICGPFMSDFDAVMPLLHAAQAIIQLAAPTSSSLAGTLRHLLNDSRQAEACRQRAAAVAARHTGVAARIGDILENCLHPIPNYNTS